MYETFTIDPTQKQNTFNPIQHINLLKFEDKFAFLDVLYNYSLPSFMTPRRLTVTNFIIQEYRASHSQNMLEYFEKDFNLPKVFPIRLSDYEKIRRIAEEDNNFYDCPIIKKF